MSRDRRNDPIGVFDSGVGGLSVLRELRKLLPRERFIFVADQQNVPYGGKTRRQLERLTERICRFLMRRRVKLVVVACNTATCYAITHLRMKFPVPFVGTVPAVKPAAASTRAGVIAVISTPATARSGALQSLINEHAEGVRVITIGCPGLEEAVECGGLDTPKTRALLRRYLGRVRRIQADRLVLGCTHYPFLKRTIRHILPIKLMDSGAAIAHRTRWLLARHSLVAHGGPGTASYFTNSDTEAFDRTASLLLRTRIRSQRGRW